MPFSEIFALPDAHRRLDGGGRPAQCCLAGD